MSNKNKLNLDGLISTKKNSISTKDVSIPNENQLIQNKDKNDMPLNFRVSSDFRKRFRVFAASHDLKLNELLVLAFDHYVKQKQN